MITLLIKASVILAAILLFYKIFLEKESFFASNRAYLLLGLALTFILPFISIPQLVKGQGLLSNAIETHIEEPSLNQKQTSDLPTKQDATEIESSKDETILVPIEKKEEDTTIEAVNTSSSKSSNKSVWFWITLIYYFGVGVFTLNFLAQFVNIVFKIYRSTDKIYDDGYVIVNSPYIKEPCSFFKYIFINPESYDLETYEQIVAHEKLHVKKRHSIDLILSELTTIILWFNPIVWLFRKEVEKNIEYQTDALLLNTKKVKKDSYQMNLLKVATYRKPLTLTTNYNQSLLKNRILKMSTKKSNPHSYWKYMFILPLVLTVLLLINKPLPMVAQNSTEEPFINDTNLQNESQPNVVLPTDYYKEPANPLKTNKQVKNANVASEGTLLTEEKGADDECTPLLEAIRQQDVIKVINLIKSIDVNCISLKPGNEIIQGDQDGIHIRRSKARTPLSAAARVGNLEITKLLVEAGATIDYYYGGDFTALSEAAHEGHTNIAKFLIEKGADLNLSGGPYGSALASAAARGHVETVTFLISKNADVNLNNGGGAYGSALASAANGGFDKVIELLLAKGAKINTKGGAYGNALSTAANNGHTKAVALLLTKGADINAKGGAYGTALNTAANNGHTGVIELLIAKGVNIDAKAGAYGTALSTAANNGHTETVELLITKGADMNAKGGAYGTPLNTAANNGHVKTVELLLSKGADINAKGGAYGTPLATAANNGHIKTIELLIAKGADMNAKGGAYGTALNTAANNGHDETVALLITKGANMNTNAGSYGTALSTAANNGNLKTVELLIKKGADMNATGGAYGNPLNTAANNGHDKTVALLLNKGANIDGVAGAYGSALSTAANNGHLSTVKLLVSKGANVNIQGGAHGTPLSTAYSSGHRKVAEYLESKGAKLKNEN